MILILGIFDTVLNHNIPPISKFTILKCIKFSTFPEDDKKSKPVGKYYLRNIY